ncbi:type II toxin-antitoxin system RelB/DinJ family antitoxin [Levilactobacillus fuyuanensis]|uniref:Type II toxin-antitoxin system RelB/DinJ family antitoxin n=1 Tax=Levilactobacillus fuyuanensis TaxID=2486022 RepID=A0ABW4H2S5_9LACO|nr:type II toxin-antitoxin system RelB/DinJ family antitoxin [Levilactobacillus fuyuanensis]
MKYPEQVLVTIRMNLNQKKKAEQVANNMSIDLSTAVNLFISPMIKENGLPFKPTNDSVAIDLAGALEDIKNGNVSKFNSVDDFMKHLHELESDDSSDNS